MVGGSGLIGDKVMTALHEAGHHAVAASPAFGIDAFTGEGLHEAMAGADVVVDVSNAAAWEDDKVLEFFTTVTSNALKAGRRAGARHDVALLGPRLRPVARERLHARQGRARGADPKRRGAVHHRALDAVHALPGTRRRHGHRGRRRRARPDTRVQPVAAGEVARFVAAAATEPPARGVVELAGPEALAFTDAIARVPATRGDRRRVVADPDARYFGAVVRGDRFLTVPEAPIATLRLADWLAGPREKAAA